MSRTASSARIPSTRTSRPSGSVAVTFAAPSMTWWLVMMRPLGETKKPVPEADLASFASEMVRRTTDGLASSASSGELEGARRARAGEQEDAERREDEREPHGSVEHTLLGGLGRAMRGVVSSGPHP